MLALIVQHHLILVVIVCGIVASQHVVSRHHQFQDERDDFPVEGTDNHMIRTVGPNNLQFRPEASQGALHFMYNRYPLRPEPTARDDDDDIMTEMNSPAIINRDIENEANHAQSVEPQSLRIDTHAEFGHHNHQQRQMQLSRERFQSGSNFPGQDNSFRTSSVRPSNQQLIFNNNNNNQRPSSNDKPIQFHNQDLQVQVPIRGGIGQNFHQFAFQRPLGKDEKPSPLHQHTNMPNLHLHLRPPQQQQQQQQLQPLLPQTQPKQSPSILGSIMDFFLPGVRNMINPSISIQNTQNEHHLVTPVPPESHGLDQDLLPQFEFESMRNKIPPIQVSTTSKTNSIEQPSVVSRSSETTAKAKRVKFARNLHHRHHILPKSIPEPNPTMTINERVSNEPPSQTMLPIIQIPTINSQSISDSMSPHRTTRVPPKMIPRIIPYAVAYFSPFHGGLGSSTIAPPALPTPQALISQQETSENPWIPAPIPAFPSSQREASLPQSLDLAPWPMPESLPFPATTTASFLSVFSQDLSNNEATTTSTTIPTTTTTTPATKTTIPTTTTPTTTMTNPTTTTMVTTMTSPTTTMTTPTTTTTPTTLTTTVPTTTTPMTMTTTPTTTTTIPTTTTTIPTTTTTVPTTTTPTTTTTTTTTPTTTTTTTPTTTTTVLTTTTTTTIPIPTWTTVPTATTVSMTTAPEIVTNPAENQLAKLEAQKEFLSELMTPESAEMLSLLKATFPNELKEISGSPTRKPIEEMWSDATSTTSITLPTSTSPSASPTTTTTRHPYLFIFRTMQAIPPDKREKLESLFPALADFAQHHLANNAADLGINGTPANGALLVHVLPTSSSPATIIEKAAAAAATTTTVELSTKTIGLDQVQLSATTELQSEFIPGNLQAITGNSLSNLDTETTNAPITIPTTQTTMTTIPTTTTTMPTTTTTVPTTTPTTTTTVPTTTPTTTTTVPTTTTTVPTTTTTIPTTTTTTTTIPTTTTTIPTTTTTIPTTTTTIPTTTTTIPTTTTTIPTTTTIIPTTTTTIPTTTTTIPTTTTTIPTTTITIPTTTTTIPTTTTTIPTTTTTIPTTTTTVPTTTTTTIPTTTTTVPTTTTIIPTSTTTIPTTLTTTVIMPTTTTTVAIISTTQTTPTISNASSSVLQNVDFIDQVTQATKSNSDSQHELSELPLLQLLSETPSTASTTSRSPFELGITPFFAQAISTTEHHELESPIDTISQEFFSPAIAKPISSIDQNQAAKGVEVIEQVLQDSLINAARLKANMHELQRLRANFETLGLPEPGRTWAWRRILHMSVEGIIKTGDLADRLRLLAAELQLAKRGEYLARRRFDVIDETLSKQ